MQIRIDENLNRSFAAVSKIINILIHKLLIYNTLQLKILDGGETKGTLATFLRECDL